MSETQQAPEGKIKGSGDKKKAKIGGSKTVRYVARAISGLSKEEWTALAREAQEVHMKAAKRALIAQAKIAAKPPSEGKKEKKADSIDETVFDDEDGDD